ncbi:MMPL family transporter [Kitasatospora aburaviensis]
MLNRIADLAINRPKRVLLITLIAALAFAALGVGLTSRVTLGGYGSPGTESSRAAEALEDRFDQGPPNLVILVQDERGVDAPDVAAAGAELTRKVAAEQGVSDVVSYWTTQSSAMRGKDHKQALVLGRIVGDFDTVQERAKVLKKTYSGTVDGLDVKLGGSGLMWVENLETAADDSLKAEAFFIPVVLVLLVLIFGSLRAALLPWPSRSPRRSW